MKQTFFKICSKFDLEDYLLPEIVNETRRAQNASINIFRVYQIIVEIITAVIGIILIGGVVLSVHRSLILFLILAVIAPIADNIYQIIQKRFLLYKNTQKQKEEDEYIKFLTKSEHLKEIKLLNCFNFVFDKWLKIRLSIMKSEQKAQTKILLVSLAFNIVRIAGTVGAYWSMTSLFIGKQISLADFSMAILTFSQITQLFNQLFSLFGNLSEFSIMVKPYFVFLEKAMEKSPKRSAISKKGEAVVLKNISFKYPNSDSWALKNIDLTIHQGDFISIVGENGSGKTTLSKIILGFLTPTEGSMRKYNEIEKSYLMEDYLKNVSYIPQTFHCYYISIKDNILFGKPIENDLLDQLLENMGLPDLKNQKDIYYGLEFGGIELSGGQKQRIAILRSMLKKANLLIFDEPTSAIDPLQESFVYRTLLNTSKGKTTIMISHRLALTKQSDQIIVLKNGEIAEVGNHENLMKKNGEYANMWNSQSSLYLT
jgi:ABC-type bacteriocin/lantibiotic exporter with double-glycine peptidase domain